MDENNQNQTPGNKPEAGTSASPGPTREERLPRSESIALGCGCLLALAFVVIVLWAGFQRG